MFYFNQCNNGLTSEDYHVLVVLSLQCVSCLATVQSWVLWRKAILQIETAASSMSVDVWVVLICYSTQLGARKKPNVLTKNEQTSSRRKHVLSVADNTLIDTFFSINIFLWRLLALFHCRESHLSFASGSLKPLVLTWYLQVFHGAGVVTVWTNCVLWYAHLNI